MEEYPIGLTASAAVGAKSVSITFQPVEGSDTAYNIVKVHSQPPLRAKGELDHNVALQVHVVPEGLPGRPYLTQ